MLSKLLTFLLILSLSACAPRATAQPARLTVLAAASLTEAFAEIGALYEVSHPNVKVEFNFAGSQQLAQQIAQGAPGDVFASANQRQMDAAVASGRVAESSVRPFARNRLVVIYPMTGPAPLANLTDLSKPGLKLVLAALEVPVGQYSLEFLDKAAQDPAYGAQYKESVLANVVSYEDSVRAVLSKVSLGEADAGIVYTSDISGIPAEKLGRITIPAELNLIASYPIAPLADSAIPDLAQDFVDLVLSEEGQGVLAKYGFESVDR